MRAAIVVLIVCAGCRASFSKWGGTPPRKSDAVKIALAAETGKASVAWRMIERDPRVTIVAYDEHVDDEAKASCGAPECENRLVRACRWSKQQGLDYYVTSSVVTRHDVETACTKYRSVSVFDDDDDDGGGCVETKIARQGAHSTFMLTVYDANTCEEVTPLRESVREYVAGEEVPSKAAAEAAVGEAARQKWKGFPAQLTVRDDSRAVGDDGQYALFRGGEFTTLVALHDNQIQNLLCCSEPATGDLLVRRGDVKYIELLLAVESALVHRDGGEHVGVGAGLHVRRFDLAGGLQYGATATTINAGGTTGVGQLAIEAGWGFRPHGAWHVSANLAAGGTYFVHGTGDMRESAWAPYIAPNLRALFRLETWWFAGADVGFAASTTAIETRLRGPYARLYGGITF